MATTRIKKVRTRNELDEAVDDYITQGYRVANEGDRTVMVQQNTWGSAGGHALWALLTIWWCFGLGNLGYALYAHYDAPKVLIKLVGGKGGRADEDDD